MAAEARANDERGHGKRLLALAAACASLAAVCWVKLAFFLGGGHGKERGFALLDPVNLLCLCGLILCATLTIVLLIVVIVCRWRRRGGGRD